MKVVTFEGVRGYRQRRSDECIFLLGSHSSVGRQVGSLVMQGMLRFRELATQASRGLRTELSGSIHCFGCSALTPVEMGGCLCVGGGCGRGSCPALCGWRSSAT